MGAGRHRGAVIAAAVVVGFAGCVVLAYALLNPAPRGPVPGRYAAMSTVAHAYVEAAEHQDCGLT
ncbi:hypothetical protein SB717_34965, partial [Priestia sp. SIMBA_032]